MSEPDPPGGNPKQKPIETRPTLEGASGETRLQDEFVLEPEPEPPAIPGYRVVGRLGVGGMAEVWEAEQESLGRHVAIKLMAARLASNPHFAKRFDREARSLAGLSHPGVVGIHDRGKVGDQLYYVMEFVEGLSLREILQQAGGLLEPKQALDLLTQVAAALAYVHGQGVVHRDIKPENVMVAPGGRVKLADFGLASVEEQKSEEQQLTATNIAMGTVQYMSPEQGQNARDVDHRSDIYSFGVMLYECLTGAYPAGSWKPASMVGPGVPDSLDPVVNACLAYQADDRYARTDDLVTDLRSVAGGGTAAVAAAMTPAPVAQVAQPGEGPQPKVWDQHDQELENLEGLDLDPELEPGKKETPPAAPTPTPPSQPDQVPTDIPAAPPTAAGVAAAGLAAAAVAGAGDPPEPPPSELPPLEIEPVDALEVSQPSGRLVDRIASTVPGSKADVGIAPEPAPEPKPAATAPVTAPPPSPDENPFAGSSRNSFPWQAALPVGLGVLLFALWGGPGGSTPSRPPVTYRPPTATYRPPPPPTRSTAPTPTDRTAAPSPTAPATPDAPPVREGLDPKDRKAVLAALKSQNPSEVKEALDLETYGEIKYKASFLGRILHATSSSAVAELLIPHLADRRDDEYAVQALVRHVRLRGPGWSEAKTLLERRGTPIRPATRVDLSAIATVNRLQPGDPELIPSIRLLALMRGDRATTALQKARRSTLRGIRMEAARSWESRWESGLVESRK